MKTALWIVFALLAALWTGTALVSAELTGWLAATVASGAAGDVINNVGQWPVPAWLALWVDPAWLTALQGVWADAFTWLSGLLPATAGWAGALLGWVAPLLWLVWAVVLGLMLLLAGGLHWLIARRSPTALPGH